MAWPTKPRWILCRTGFVPEFCSSKITQECRILDNTCKYSKRSYLVKYNFLSTYHFRVEVKPRATHVIFTMISANLLPRNNSCHFYDKKTFSCKQTQPLAGLAQGSTQASNAAIPA